MNIKLTIPIIAAIALAGVSCTKEFNESSSAQENAHPLTMKLVGGNEGEIIEGNILVKLDEKTTQAIENGRIGELSEDLFGQIEVTSFMPAIPARPKNMEVAKKYGLHQWFVMKFSEETPAREVAQLMARSPRVRSIQFNKVVVPIRSEISHEFEPIPLTKSEEEAASALPFDDPYNKYQWNLYNDGTACRGAVAGADVGVKDAWRLTGGDRSVIVGIFDTAVDELNPDLTDAVWRNEAEIDGESGKDDDGNGFIDDKYGFNFVGCYSITEDMVKDGLYNGGKFTAIKNNALNAGGGSGHGTHVGGIVGATNNNGVGVSSVAGGTGVGDGVRLMSCQIFEGNDKVSGDIQKAAAYIYAADNGACIAQCSYGSSYVLKEDSQYINGGTIIVDGKELELNSYPLEYAALQYFLDPANSNHECLEGNIAIFASGNYGNPYSIYPGAFSDVISVTAIGCDFLPGGYTNYGPGCNIAAPGGEIKDASTDYSTLILSTGTAFSTGTSLGLDINGKKSKNYVYMYGTSMACPHVSGVAALGISYAKKLGKKFTREEFTSLLLTSVHDIDQYLTRGTKKFYDLRTSTYVDIPLNQYFGKMGTGAVDAWKFLMAIEGTPSVMVKVGEKAKIDLSRYCNPSATYQISMDEASRTSLGVTSNPVQKDGFLEIECSAIGAGKIVLSGSVGADPDKADGIGGMNYTREISIVSRPFATQNGGWL